MNVLVFGAGNVLLADEGFGVHAVRYLEENFEFPEGVEVFDAGTLGLMATYKMEEAEHILMIDVIAGEGTPGDIRTYGREDIMLDRIPAKLSPHQIGLQEVMLISEMRGKCPESIKLYGVIPQSIQAGDSLTEPLQAVLADVCERVVRDVEALGFEVKRK
ncbi:HyaD/HybD family hydrogenase maturation endopeptidase [Limisalsivibrio acetivorans]|uniref:HyaD/HybD family hydrogenase maturation endopeptidase n=1 Tax=Limisalsivibrio acetivorans TaxID=1304888 RepID=UPI0003B3111D|nr:HyaD/HybD family hydrogenase maturation endopeptidase [Limisalsivibrio acetivorans]